jgi:hypothetical protein
VLSFIVVYVSDPAQCISYRSCLHSMSRATCVTIVSIDRGARHSTYSTINEDRTCHGLPQFSTRVKLAHAHPRWSSRLGKQDCKHITQRTSERSSTKLRSSAILQSVYEELSQVSQSRHLLIRNVMVMMDQQKCWQMRAWNSMPILTLMRLTLNILQPFGYEPRPSVIKIRFCSLLYSIVTS